MRCPSCEFESPDGMKFCGRCGARLALVCAACGTEAAPGFRFCGQCGSALGAEGGAAAGGAPAAAPPPATASRPEPPLAAEGERKQVTVVHCEIAGAQALAATLGSEATHRLLSRFAARAQADVERFGGTVHRSLGFGFVALFGAPVAYEDHALRGVLAALELTEAVERDPADLGLAPGAGLRLAVGIDTGSLLVGGGGDVAVGETPASAEALHRRAAAGGIVLSPRTARLAGRRLRTEPLAAEEGEPLAWRVTGRASGLAELESFDRSALSPFVGRGRELAVLGELERQADTGQGQVVGIAGDAGSGKSRLLYELRRGLEDRPVVYLMGQCVSYRTGVPYSPLVGMLRVASKIQETDPAATVAEKLATSLRSIGCDERGPLPYLLRLLGVREGAEELEGVEAQAIKSRTFAALRQMVLAATRRSLVVFEIEDLHWIDETTEDFLASLVEVVGASRVLMLFTYRSGYRPRWLDKSYSTQITMRRLSLEDSRAIVEPLLRRGGQEAARAGSIVEAADGNPFFLEELARAIAETPEGESELPETVQGLLMARLDRLPESHKRLLQAASVLGREFSVSLLGALWDVAAPVEPILGDLARWEFLYELPSEQGSYLFKHALTQEVAYQSLLGDRRRALHRAAAKALEEQYRGRIDEALEQLIVHFPKAGDPVETVRYLTRFADKVARGFAHSEAAAALYEALAHAEKLPEEQRGAKVAELTLRLADSLLPLARFPETLDLLERYRERIEGLGAPAITGRLRFWLAHTHCYLGHPEETARIAESAIAAAREAADESTEGKALYVLGRDAFWAGDFAIGADHSQRAIVLLERSGEPWWQGQAYWVSGFHHFMRGDSARALDAMRRAQAIGEALDDYRLDASWSEGYILAAIGDAEAGVARCRAGLERSRDLLNSPAAMGFLGYALLRAGDPTQAEETLAPAVEALAAAGVGQLQGWFLSYLAESRQALGRPAEALRAAEEALAVSEAAAFRFGTALATRTLGRLALAAGDRERAVSRLEEASRRFEELGVPLELARTLVDLARCAGEAERARKEIERARGIFAELGLDPGREIRAAPGVEPDAAPGAAADGAPG